MIIINNHDLTYSTWEYKNKIIRLDFGKNGGATVYSEPYQLVLAMDYTNLSLNLKAYTLDGVYQRDILAKAEEKLLYQYIRNNELSKSNVAVIATPEIERGNFPDWQYEVDLDNFIIGKIIGPSY